MNHRDRLFHDLKDTFFVLEHHSQRILARLPHEHNDTCQDSSAFEASLQHFRFLFEQWQLSSSEESIDQVASLPLVHWSDIMEKEILPPLARMHEVDIHFEGYSVGKAQVVMNLPFCQRISCNLIANARAAGASHLHVEVIDRGPYVDLIFRDNGKGMTAAQIDALGFGFTQHNTAGHGRGFRIVRKLAADFGAVIRTPQSIPGTGTTITVSVMKVGCCLD